MGVGSLSVIKKTSPVWRAVQGRSGYCLEDNGMALSAWVGAVLQECYRNAITKIGRSR